MTRIGTELVVAGLAVLALGAAPVPGAAAGPTAQPAGVIGHVVAVTPKYETIVVDVPEGHDVLRLGATVTPHTVIRVNGTAAPLTALKAGEQVRIAYQRTPGGDVATSVIAG